MKVIPSRITLNYDRPLHFQYTPEIIKDASPHDDFTVIVTRNWVVVGRADVIEPLLDLGAPVNVMVGQRWRGSVKRGGGWWTEVTLGEIIAERYVNHVAHGRTRYVAVTVLRPRATPMMWRGRLRVEK